jgi:redox-sensitive bicupin YhaK (pirin superfamily)
MITRHPARQRGHLNHGWLDTWHTFSFGTFHDPGRMGFRALRVINEDVVAPGQGFGRHPHRDMEILTYIITGELTHQDNLGHTAAIRPGRVQRMSAGTGIEHAEFNASPTVPVHLLQIWLQPDADGHTPSYEERDLLPDDSQAADGQPAWQLIAAPATAGPTAEAMAWYTEARLLVGKLAAGQSLRHEPAAGRHAWLQMVSGQALVNGTELAAGDGAAVSDEPLVELLAREATTVLLFDLA